MISENFRLKIEEKTTGNIRYLTRRNGRISLISQAEVPLSLTYLVHNAAELRFKLEDAENGQQAKEALDRILSIAWKENYRQQPIVTVF